MIYGLRRYDVDRSIALANMYRDPISGSKKHHLDMDSGDTGTFVVPRRHQCICNLLLIS